MPAPAAGAAAPSPAEQDYAAFQVLWNMEPPTPPNEMGKEKFLRWLDELRQKLQVAGLAFYEKYPTDPRRWELVLGLINAPPFYAKSFGPDVEERGLATAVIDEAAQAAWAAKAETLRQALLASADARPEARESVEWSAFGQDFSAQSAAKQKGEKYDFSGFPTRFDAHVAKYAQLDVLPDRANDYLGALEQVEPGTTPTIWKHLLDAPNAALREAAAKRLRFLDLASKPLDLAFTAADGREIDLKTMRGKVVLVDFWATWCGPCKEEIPNVKKVYSAYHDKGFEVVGIALENGRLAPGDSAEKTAAKLAVARKVLTDFTAANAMPWPQYFDGKYWKTDIATQYAIQSIPAMFLVDQDGKIVSTNARGEALEKEVKRLLKL
jgi:thiol-disulfide isomerase/thioredoxin